MAAVFKIALMALTSFYFKHQYRIMVRDGVTMWVNIKEISPWEKFDFGYKKVKGGRLW